MALLPFRLVVLQRASALMKTITPANGYVGDLSDLVDGAVTVERVFRGRTEFGFNDPRPMLSIRERPVSPDQFYGSSTSTLRTGWWDLMMQGFVEDDPENPTDPAQILAADVTKAWATEKQRDGNILGFGDTKPCVTDVQIGPPSCHGPDGEVSDVGFFFLPISLKLVEDLSQPFISI